VKRRVSWRLAKAQIGAVVPKEEKTKEQPALEYPENARNQRITHVMRYHDPGRENLVTL
jgi:hypothetical protein